MIKALSIKILKPKADAGVGFAMEAIAKIASSVSGKQSDLKESIDNLGRIIERTFEEKESQDD